jgi:hypothetical protein
LAKKASVGTAKAAASASDDDYLAVVSELVGHDELRIVKGRRGAM